MARNLSSVSLSEALGIIFMSSDSEDEQCDPFYFSEDVTDINVSLESNYRTPYPIFENLALYTYFELTILTSIMNK